MKEHIEMAALMGALTAGAEQLWGSDGFGGR